MHLVLDTDRYTNRLYKIVTAQCCVMLHFLIAMCCKKPFNIYFRVKFHFDHSQKINKDFRLV